jgi:hypothetical protein
VTREIPFEQAGSIELELANPGTVPITGIRLTVVPPADVRLPAETELVVPDLRPGESRILPLPFGPSGKGTYVLNVRVRYEAGGQPYQTEFPAQVRVV